MFLFRFASTLLLLLLLPLSGFAATYWVDTNGSDSANGSSTTPWRTIQHAVDTISSGDTVNVRSGVYAENVIIGNFTLAGSTTLIQSAPANTAILDGTTASGPVAFYLENQQSVTVRGFEIRNYSSSLAWELAAGFYVAGQSADIALSDNNIHNIANTHPTSPIANGIGIYGTTPTPLTNVRILDNRVHDLILGWSESVVINGNVDGFQVIGNAVHDNNNIGIDIIGYEDWIEQGGVPASLNRARNGVVRRNHVYNIDSATNPVYAGDRSAGGIYVDGGTDVTIEQNFIHDSNIGIELASEATDGFTDFVTVNDNEIWYNHLAGVALGGYQSQLGQTQNVTLNNNSFYNNATDAVNGVGEIWFQFNVSANQILDNIVHGGSGAALLYDANNQLPLNTFNDNLFDTNQANGYFYVNGVAIAQTLTDPEFENAATGDLRLNSTSPAQTGGVAHTGIRTTDRLGRERVVATTPAATTLISPSGSASSTPSYSWNAVSNSSWYYLWVNDATGTPIKKWYTAALADCAGGTGVCTVTPATAVIGDVSWWVRTWNTNGSGPWSTALQFSVPPAQATLVSPNGTGSGSTPVYIWNAVAGSSWYYLWVNDSTGNVVRQWITKADAGCSSGTGTCSFNPSISVSGSSKWWIRTWNKSGSGPWSGAMTFSP